MATSVSWRERRSKNRRRRSSGRTKGRGGARIQAPNLEQAYRDAGLGTGGAEDEAWQQAHGAAADDISVAKQLLPGLDAAAVSADLDQLLELLAQQRNEARRRYAEEFRRRPGGPDAMRAKQAADALDVALSRAVTLREQQTRRERDPSKRPKRVRRLLRKPPPANAAEAAQPGRLPRELGKVRRQAGTAHQRGVHSSVEFDPDKPVAAQARTATPEQLRASRDALPDARGQYGDQADVALAAADAEITAELLKKDLAERNADGYAVRHYGLTADQLRERDGLPQERLARNAHDPYAARREVDNIVEQQNAAPGPQPTMRQSLRPGPVAVASAGGPPDRGSGAGPRSHSARIAAQSARAQEVQDLRRTQRAA